MIYLLLAPFIVAGLSFGLAMTNTNVRNKTLNRGRCVRVMVVYKDKRIRSFYRIPKGNTITADGRTYSINEKDVLNTKGIPTYLYVTERAEPLDVYDVQKSNVSPEELNIAINSRVASEILDSMGGRLSAQAVVMIMGFLTLGVLAVFGYLLYTELGTLAEQINEVREILREVTGR